MPSRVTKPRTVGSTTFNPGGFFTACSDGTIPAAPESNDLRSWVIKSYGLKEDDDYVYHAMASVTLRQVQQAINAGGQNGLHAWYRDVDGKQIDPPPQADIQAYFSIFSPSVSTPKALTALASNAKKGSLRSSIAAHLKSTRVTPSTMSIPKQKNPVPNPYYDIWAWSCRTLEWAGPEPNTINVRQSHHILPVLYHHFGCVCPSHESLEIIRQAGRERVIVEIGSGNGYWTHMLRRLGLRVEAVDNGASEWRTMWIGDTIYEDGVQYLQKNDKGRAAVLLLVYPQVGHDFTGKVLRAYEGTTVVVAGTQNRNGYTAFAGETIADWMAREKSAYQKKIQVALPSFAGKDEALFVFEKE